ncbi:MAG: EcsC family protein [Candidatus Sumerlaeaceae bacterium]
MIESKRMLLDEDLVELRSAYEVLENPGFAVRLQGMLGAPLEQGMKYLPANWRGGIQKATEGALRRALDVATSSFSDRKESGAASNALHKLLAAGSGAVGGAFGLPALAVELPVSTVIMLRSIADVARSQGEDIRSLEAKLACLEVFALGGKEPGDDSTEAGYYAVRAVLTQQLGEVARYVAKAGIADSSAPVLMRFIGSIASRFGIVVSEKAMATAVPLIGAAGGAIINALFIDHFQGVARAHFTVRRLERIYGAGLVQSEYQKIADGH